jgi:DNA polymerase I
VARKTRPSYLARAETLADRLGRVPTHNTNGHTNGHTSKAEALEAIKRTQEEKVKGRKVPEDTLEHRLSLEEEFPEYVHTDEKALEVLEWARSTLFVSLDTETQGLLYVHHPIHLIQLSDGERTWVLDAEHVSHTLLVQILVSLKGKPVYVHNAMFDLPRLWRWFGVYLTEDVRDSYLLSKHVRAGEWRIKKGVPQTVEHSLKACLRRELGVKIPKDTEKDQWKGGITEHGLRYAIDDVLHLHALYSRLLELAEERGVVGAYEDTRKVLPLYVVAMTRGVPVNMDKLRDLLRKAREDADHWNQKAHEVAPEPPVHWLTKKRSEQVWKWNNTNKNTGYVGKGRRGSIRALSLVGVEVPDLEERTLLDHIDEHPLVEAIYQYRKKAQIVAKYRRWESDFYEDGRVFPQFSLAGTTTNRTTTSDPNLQGTSKHKNPEYRAVIEAPEGKKLLKADWSQQEVRIAAYFSGDEEMLRVYREGETDVYRRTAEELQGREVTSEERQFAKRIVLGFLYGLGIEKYRNNTYKDFGGEKYSAEEAHEHRDAFRRAFPGYLKWQQLQGTCALEVDGDVFEYDDQEGRFTTRSVRGRRRYVKPDSEGNPKYTDRINGPIQTTGADVLYVALGRLRDDQEERGLFPRCRFLLSSHDEILLEVLDDGEGEAALGWLVSHMRGALEDLLSPDFGGEGCVEAKLVKDWSG